MFFGVGESTAQRSSDGQLVEAASVGSLFVVGSVGRLVFLLVAGASFGLVCSIPSVSQPDGWRWYGWVRQTGVAALASIL